MGGMQHLLVFDSFEDKKAIIESKWLERWFITIKNVNTHSATLWRETWINIYGVPLIGWSYENFYDIGSLFGRVLSVNYKEFDCAKVMIYTDCMFDINTKIAMEIDEETYSIYVSEKQAHWGRNPLQNEAENGGDKKDKPCHPPPPLPGMSPPRKIPNQENVNGLSDNEKMIETRKEHLEKCTSTKQNHELESPNNDDEIMNLEKGTNDSQEPTPNSKNPTNPTSENAKADVAYPTFVLTAIHSENSQTNIILSPIKSHTQKPNKKPNQSCPSLEKQTTPPDSPIKLSNKFGPLQKPNIPKPSSMSTIGSSSSSGPLFPPGFEDTIPIQTKIEKINRRKKKMEKKSKLQHSASMKHLMRIPATSNQPTNTIQIDDVIKMATDMGLVFNGPESVLRSRIGKVLLNQKLNWEANSN